jgi:uncharacterized protein (TIGR02246 family)
MTTTPEVISRYLQAADAKDTAAVAACFTEDGTVVDEGHTFTGRDEIIGWREKTISQWIYTTTIPAASHSARPNTESPRTWKATSPVASSICPSTSPCRAT